MRRRRSAFVLPFLLAAPIGADTPIATTLYKEGAGKIEGDLLADTVKSVAVDGDTVTVVQRDADAAESALTFDVGGGSGGLSQAQVDARIRPFARAATDVADLDSIGSSDVTGADELFIHDDSAGEVARVDMGDVADYVSDALDDTPTNLGYTPAPGKGTVTSSSGADADLPVADATNAGLMAPAQRTKLAGIEAGATADQSPAEIRDALAGLTGTARLDAGSIKDLPSGAQPPTKSQVYAHVKEIVQANRGIQAGDNDVSETVTLGQVQLRRTDAQIEALAADGVAEFARQGALVDDDVDHVQQIFDAFDGGGWVDAAGAGDSGAEYPYVREQISTSPYTASSIQTGTYGQSYLGGPHYGAAYIGVRVPTIYRPVGEIALVIGQRIPDDPDLITTQHFPIPSSSKVTLMTTTTTYSFYQVGPVDKPAGEGWRVQAQAPFQLDRRKVSVSSAVEGAFPDPTTAELEAGTETGARLWSPADVRASIEAFTPHRLGVDVVEDGAHTLVLGGQGVQQDNRPAAANYFDPPFNLDDADKQHGEFHVSVDLRLHDVSAGGVNLGFVRNKANQDSEDRERTLTGIVFASDLRQEPDFVVQADLDGINVFNQPAYSLTTLAGTYYFMLVRRTHDSQTQVGYYDWWDGEAGSETASLSTEVRISWTPTDPGAAAGAAARSFALAARPTADVDLAVPAGSVAGAWSPWTRLAAAAAVQAAQAGPVLVSGQGACAVVEASTGGGDRVLIEARLVRVRASTATTLATARTYGPRNLASNAANTSAAFAAASREAVAATLWSDTAAAADVYAVEARAISQIVTAAVRTVRCAAADSGVLVAPI